MTTSEAERFWALVDRTGECWVWSACTQGGYGYFKSGPWRTPVTKLAHRWVWEARYGPIPDGMQIDHLCRNPPCCRPEHLECVTPAENFLRSSAPTAIACRTDTCKRGHSLLDAYVPKDGHRRCRTCKNMRDKAKQEALRKLTRERSEPRPLTTRHGGVAWIFEAAFTEETA